MGGGWPHWTTRPCRPRWSNGCDWRHRGNWPCGCYRSRWSCRTCWRCRSHWTYRTHWPRRFYRTRWINWPCWPDWPCWFRGRCWSCRTSRCHGSDRRNRPCGRDRRGWSKRRHRLNRSRWPDWSLGIPWPSRPGRTDRFPLLAQPRQWRQHHHLLFGARRPGLHHELSERHLQRLVSGSRFARRDTQRYSRACQLHCELFEGGRVQLLRQRV